MPPDSQVFALPGGRVLGFAQYGIPSGAAVFYFHGWPASRLEAALAGGLPVNLIAVDRPGFGLSDPQPARRLVDWPADIDALADGLGVGNYHVVGVSGGAPYALACAAMSGRVKGAALVCPIPPLAAPAAPPAEMLGEGLRRLQQLGQRPGVARAVVTGVRMAIQAGLLDPRTALLAGCAACDRACVDEAAQLAITGSWREGLRRGVEGAVSDARIFADPWGFDPAAIPCPIQLWHGEDDLVVPVATLVAYKALPATRHVLAGQGHYSLPLTQATLIMAGLVG